MDRTFFTLGSIFALLAVAAGAFGAHVLEQRLTPERLATFELAARYQMYHGLALLAAGWAATRWDSPAVTVAGWAFVAGILIFCGTVYALSFGSPRWFGAITPIGGMSFLLGWALLAWSAARG